MNSIRRRRRRPRVDSVNFRTFAWVLLREAVFELHSPDFLTLTDGITSRSFLREFPTSKVRLLGENLLRFYPWRRFTR